MTSFLNRYFSFYQKSKKMKHQKYILTLLAFLLSIANLIQAQDWANLNKYSMANQEIDGTNRVVFMGNSITEGWSQINPDFFKGKPYINRGISGQTTPQMLVRFRADVIDLQPKVVVILAGTNDIAENTGPMTLSAIAGNIMSMAELAQANGIKVILASVLPAFDYAWKPGLEPNIKIPKLNKMIKTYADKKGMIYLDYFTPMVDKRNGLKKEYSEDGVHPNLLGYQVMEPLAEVAIAKALK